MNFVEKSRIRIEHWIHHNLDHLENYKAFADELEAAGKDECAWRIRAMGDLMSQSNDYLKEALLYLEQADQQLSTTCKTRSGQ